MSVVENYLSSYINKNVKFDSNPSLEFSPNLYFENLKTKNFGTIVLYTDVTSSTMNTFDR